MKKYFQTTKIAIAFNDAAQHKQLLTYFGKEFRQPWNQKAVCTFFIEKKQNGSTLLKNEYQCADAEFASAYLPGYATISFNEFLFLTNPAAIWPASQLLPTQKNK